MTFEAQRTDDRKEELLRQIGIQLESIAKISRSYSESMGK